MPTISDLPNFDSPEQRARVPVFGDYRTLQIRVLTPDGGNVCEKVHSIGPGEVQFYLQDGQIAIENLSFEWVTEAQTEIQWAEFCLKGSPNRGDVILGYLNTGTPIDLPEGQPLTISDLEWPVLTVPDVQ